MSYLAKIPGLKPLPESAMLILLPCLWEGKRVNYQLEKSTCPVCGKQCHSSKERNMVIDKCMYHEGCLPKESGLFVDERYVKAKIVFGYHSPNDPIIPFKGFTPII